MQDQSALTRTFFHRTNRLAAQMRLQVEDLPELLAMGRRTFFECRSADSKVSAKSWAKLDEAERSLDQGRIPAPFAVMSGNPNQSTIPKEDAYSSKVSEDVVEYKYTPRPPPLNQVPQKIVLMEQTIDGMMAQLQIMKDMLQTMKGEQ